MILSSIHAMRSLITRRYKRDLEQYPISTSHVTSTFDFQTTHHHFLKDLFISKYRSHNSIENNLLECKKHQFWKQWANVLYLQEINSFQEWTEKYGPNDTDASAELFAVMQMFVEAGVLLRKKIIDPVELFKYLPHVTLPMTYQKIRPFIEGMREAYNDPLFGEDFEYLYNEAMKLYPDLSIPSDRTNAFMIQNSTENPVNR